MNQLHQERLDYLPQSAKTINKSLIFKSNKDIDDKLNEIGDTKLNQYTDITYNNQCPRYQEQTKDIPMLSSLYVFMKILVKIYGDVIYPIMDWMNWIIFHWKQTIDCQTKVD